MEVKLQDSKILLNQRHRPRTHLFTLRLWIWLHWRYVLWVNLFLLYLVPSFFVALVLELVARDQHKIHFILQTSLYHNTKQRYIAEVSNPQLFFKIPLLAVDRLKKWICWLVAPFPESHRILHGIWSDYPQRCCKIHLNSVMHPRNIFRIFFLRKTIMLRLQWLSRSVYGDEPLAGNYRAKYWGTSI